MRVSFPIIQMILIAVVTVLTAYNSLFSLGFLFILILEVLRERKLDEMERYHRLEAALFTLYAVISVTVVLFVLSIKLINDVLFLYTLFPLMLKNMLAAGRSWERKRVILLTHSQSPKRDEILAGSRPASTGSSRGHAGVG